jgi:hypothetical protein
MKVAIHQPEHLPWLGLLDKIARVDTWIVLDHVQFRSNYFQNRNRILGQQGPVWLTAPVASPHLIPLNKISINNNRNWKKKCWLTMQQHYAHAPFFKNHSNFFKDLYHHNWTSLCELNLHIIEYLLCAFEIKTRMIKSSTMPVTEKKGALIARLCELVGAKTYSSGVSGKDYLNPADFETRGIHVEYQEFYHPIYKQQDETFYPTLSSIDLLFNHGPDSNGILFNKHQLRLEEIVQ